MTENKIILLIGRTGRGKSTLANVITNTNNFKESAGSISETRKVQSEKFEGKGDDINYLIIDTPGIGDTKLSDHQVLDIIAEAVYLARNGISQVFFVTNGRFDQYEMATYDLLRTIIFDSDITNHTTLVRTYFSEFRDEEEWGADIERMIKEAGKKRNELEKTIAAKKKEKKKVYLLLTNNDQYKEFSREIKDLEKKLASTNLAEIIESCQERIVYVDNPSLEVDDAKKLEMNKEDREESREILIEHLSKNCQGLSYKPPKLQELSNEIANDYFEYLKKKEELEKELERFRSQEIRITKDSNNNIFAEISKIEPVFAKSKEETKDENNIGIFEKEELRKKISQLQDKKERLQKEIAEKEKIIRQKVLKHIFNNYQEINRELGGDIFLNSVIGDHNWLGISQEFINKELVVKWLSHGFDYQQTQKWASVLENNFNPKIDADFCAWLRDNKQLTVEKIKELNHFIDIKLLRSEYAQWLEKENFILTKHNQQLIPRKGSNSQEYLDKNYPKETRRFQKELIINQESLEGHLDLRDFVNLERLDCLNNQLTSCDFSNCRQLKVLLCGSNQLAELNLTNLNQLEIIACNDNYLTSFDYSALNPEKLIYLNITANNLPKQNLTVFSKFVNLERLWIGGGDQEKINKGIYNRFFGSLEPLKDLKKLWTLHLKNTDINGGLEYLPDSIKEIHCSYWSRPESKVRWLACQLSQSPEFFLDEKDYLGADNKYRRIQKEISNEAQNWLDFHYPLGKRKEVIHLDITNKNLTGELVITDFPKLTVIDCYDNQLTKLIINNCFQLNFLSVHDNLLTNLIIDQPKQLTYLDVSNNKFPPQDLSFFQQFIDCEILYLNNNPFFGSLEPLKKLKKLKSLDISYSDIYQDLENLPERTEEISLQGVSSNPEEISQGLRFYPLRGLGRSSTYSLQQWRNNQLPYQQLKKVLERLGYIQLDNLSTDIFFNVKTGKFEGTTNSLFFFLEKLITLKKKDENDLFLERIIDDLQTTIKQQKELHSIKKSRNDNKWISFHPNFNQSLIQQWQNHGFSYRQARDWVNIGLSPQEVNFVAWLKNIKQLTPEKALNQANLEKLKVEYQQTQLQVKIIQ